ncbi:MAG: hypothetical protein K8R40_00175 [Anaerolineaceae bacterium]|nr:hypothetical protein [Anaerolineaceae bacterium]
MQKKEGELNRTVLTVAIFTFVFAVFSFLINAFFGDNWFYQKNGYYVFDKISRMMGISENDVWRYYVDDVLSDSPNADISVKMLKEIAEKIPDDIPYFAGVKNGVRPAEENGKVLETDSSVTINAAEGGYAFFSMGEGNIDVNGKSLYYQWTKGTTILVLVIGIHDDGDATTLLNSQVEVSDYVPGNIFTSFAIPAPGQHSEGGGVVNKAWFAQQLWYGQQLPNITVSIWDLNAPDIVTNYYIDAYDFVWPEY